MTDYSSNFIIPDDLEQLTHVSPESVVRFVEDINNTSEKELKGRKLVAAIGTGGTISMKVENGIRIPDLDFDNIFAQCNHKLSERFLVKGLDAFCLDSADLNYSHVRDLAIVLTYAWRNITFPFEGFLISHGTDTLPYSSAAMSLIMGQGLPFSIVYTASQKSLAEPMNDVAVNIRNALFTLEALKASDMAEVVVVMGDYAMLATSSIKVDDAAENAFSAPLHKYITSFTHLTYPVRLAGWLNPRRQVPFEPTIWRGDYSQTLVVSAMMGLAPDMVARQISDPQIKAVIIFTYGCGTAYTPMIDAALAIANKLDKPIFIVNSVMTTYKITYASGEYMVNHGITPLDLTLPAAIAKLEIALAKYPDCKNKVIEFMITNYVGEIPSQESRFVPVLYSHSRTQA